MAGSGYAREDSSSEESGSEHEISSSLRVGLGSGRARKIGLFLVLLGSCFCILGLLGLQLGQSALEERARGTKKAGDFPWISPADPLDARRRKPVVVDEGEGDKERPEGAMTLGDLDPANIGREVVRSSDGKRGLLQRGVFGGYYVQGVANKRALLRGIESGDWSFAPESDELKQPRTGRHMKVYHQTSPAICELIMKGGFKKGHGGWCGDAIYFALTPESTRTKAITKGSHDGCMIEATVDIGRVRRIQKKGTCRSYDAEKLADDGYDTVIFDPGDGNEVVLYDTNRVVSKTILPYNEKWLVPALKGRHYT